MQNGLLLRSDLHNLFDAYSFLINPDDNYKIVCFLEDGDGIAGKHLDQEFLDNPRLDNCTIGIVLYHEEEVTLSDLSLCHLALILSIGMVVMSAATDLLRLD